MILILPAGAWGETGLAMHVEPQSVPVDSEINPLLLLLLTTVNKRVEAGLGNALQNRFLTENVSEWATLLSLKCATGVAVDILRVE